MNIHTIASVVVAGLLLVACGNNSATNSTTTEQGETETSSPRAKPAEREGWRTFASKDFSIEYPAGWTLQTATSIGAKFVLLAPGAEQSAYGENINMFVQNLGSARMTAKDYSSIAMEQIRGTIADAEVLNQTMGNNGQDDFFEVTFAGSQGIVDLQWLQRFYVRGGNAYVLTYSGQRANYDKHTAEATAILDGFTLE